MSRNDFANASLINDLLATRDRMFTLLQADGGSAADAGKLLAPLDDQIARYRFAQVRMLEQEEEFPDTLQFEPARIRRPIDAGRAGAEANWR